MKLLFKTNTTIRKMWIIFLEWGLPSPSHDHNVPMPFRMVLIKIDNSLEPQTNHHFQTFVTQHNKWQYYQTSLSVYDLYSKSQYPSFQFTIIDSAFFSELLDHVLFSFLTVIKDKRMKSFSMFSVGQYAFDVISSCYRSDLNWNPLIHLIYGTLFWLMLLLLYFKNFFRNVFLRLKNSSFPTFTRVKNFSTD